MVLQCSILHVHYHRAVAQPRRQSRPPPSVMSEKDSCVELGVLWLRGGSIGITGPVDMLLENNLVNQVRRWGVKVLFKNEV